MTDAQRLNDLKWINVTRPLSRDEGDWLIRQVEAQQNANTPKPIDEWHEDDGDCLWWFFPVCEPPYCGSPLDSNFPDYVTHYTQFFVPEQAPPVTQPTIDK